MSVMRVTVSQIAHVGIMHCSDTDNFLQIPQKIGPSSSYMCRRNLSRMTILTVYFKFIEIEKDQFPYIDHPLPLAKRLSRSVSANRRFLYP